MSARPVDDREAGFTLLEVIIAAALLLVATIPIYRFFDSSVKQVTTVQGMIEEQAKARNAMTSLENDLRNSFTGSAAINRIESVSATSITFYTPDRLSPMSLRKVSYQLSGGTFRRWSLTSTNSVSGSSYSWSFPTTTAAMTYLPVVTGVTNTTVFEYRDKDNVVLNPAVATNIPKIRTIKATLQVRDPKAKTTQTADTYAVTVQLRGEG